MARHSAAPDPRGGSRKREDEKEPLRGQFATLREAERTHIMRVLEATAWTKKEAARLLAISRGTLYRKIVEYRLGAIGKAGVSYSGTDARA